MPATNESLTRLRRLRSLLEARQRTSLPFINEELEAQRGLCQRLRDFTRQAWHVIEPARAYVHGWHLDCISEHLEAVTAGQMTRVLFNVPPGMMKSLSCGVFWQAWEWGPMELPHMRFLGFSWDMELSTRDALKTRRLIQSDWYRALWGDSFRLTTDQNVKTRFENNKTGWRIADHVGGGTGERGDRDIVDDPHNVRDGESEKKRGNAITWLNETLPTRVNDPERSAIVVIMQRVHSKDVSGEILSRYEDYEHVMLPMEFEPARRCYTSLPRGPAHRMRYLRSRQIWLPEGWKPEPTKDPAQLASIESTVKEHAAARTREVYSQDPRTKDGELIFEARFPQHVVDKLKIALREYATAGQLQQRPVPREGGLFKRHWFKFLKAPPLGCRWVRHWDLAGTEDAPGKDPSHTAGCLLGRIPDGGGFVIADVQRARLEGGEVRKLVKNNAERDRQVYGEGVIIGIPQDGGQAGKTQVRDYAILLAAHNMRRLLETGSKTTRAEPLAAQAEAGNLYLVVGDWNDDFLEEACLFPAGPHDDQVDAASGAYARLVAAPEQSDLGMPVQVGR